MYGGLWRSVLLKIEQFFLYRNAILFACGNIHILSWKRTNFYPLLNYINYCIFFRPLLINFFCDYYFLFNNFFCAAFELFFFYLYIELFFTVEFLHTD